MATAFFSYSRTDSEFALRLAGDLKAAGLNVWLDQLDIVPGQRWDRAVEEELTRSPRILVILSPSSVESANVMDEVSFALEQRKTVIPIIHENCKIPFRLRRLQHVDFTKDYAGGLDDLLKALGSGSKEGRSAPVVSEVQGPIRTEIPHAVERQIEAQKESSEDERRKASEEVQLQQKRKLDAEISNPAFVVQKAGEDKAEVRERVEATRREQEIAEQAQRQAEADRMRVESEALEKAEVVRLEQERVEQSQERDELDIGPLQKLRRWSGAVVWTAGTISVIAILAYLAFRNKSQAPVTPEPKVALIVLNIGGDRLPSMEGVKSVAWSPDGKRLVTGESEGVSFWNAETGKELFTVHESPVTTVAWSPDGKLVAMGSNEKTKVLNAETGITLLTLKPLKQTVFNGSDCVAWSPHWNWLAIATYPTAQVWNAHSGEQLLTLGDPASDRSGSLAWSPDGKRLVTANSGKIKVWDTKTGENLLTIGATVQTVSWSPDGKWLAGGNEVKVWDVGTGRELRTLKGVTDHALAWSPDGKRLAATKLGTDEKVVVVLDAETGNVLIQMSAPSLFGVDALAWSPDGRRLATTSWETVKIWDTNEKPNP
jgi:WD40 repeat protein